MAHLPSLSMLQMIKGVAYCAVAFACIGPMIRLWQDGAVQNGSGAGLIVVALFEGVLVPLAWIALSLVLVRRGPWRDGLVAILLLCSLSVAQAVACWSLVRVTIPILWNSGGRDSFSALAIHSLVIVGLTAALGFVLHRLWRMQEARDVGKSDLEAPRVPG